MRFDWLITVSVQSRIGLPKRRIERKSKALGNQKPSSMNKQNGQEKLILKLFLIKA